MPRKSADPYAGFDLSKEELADMKKISDMFVRLGRAISLSALVGHAKGDGQTNTAIDAADEAWKNLAAEILTFALESR